jgi:hypothetical protein
MSWKCFKSISSRKDVWPLPSTFHVIKNIPVRNGGDFAPKPVYAHICPHWTTPGKVRWHMTTWRWCNLKMNPTLIAPKILPIQPDNMMIAKLISSMQTYKTTTKQMWIGIFVAMFASCICMFLFFWSYILCLGGTHIVFAIWISQLTATFNVTLVVDYFLIFLCESSPSESSPPLNKTQKKQNQTLQPNSCIVPDNHLERQFFLQNFGLSHLEY